MGARPSSFKKGGGFLNGVDGTITGYLFTDEFNGEPFKAGKIKDYKTGKPVDKPHSLNVLLSVRADGADEDITTTLKAAGDFDEWEVSDDGHTLTPVEDGRELGAGTAFAKLIASLCKPEDGGEGFPEERLPEDSINYEAIIGTRVRFAQKTDARRTKEFGQRKGKDGKSYDRQDLVIETVYELPTAEGKSNGKTARPTKTTTSPSKTTGKSSKAAKTDDVDLDTLAKETLLSIVADADGSIAKNKLSMKVLQKLMKHPQRENVRKLVFTDDFLAQEDGWTYNKSKQEVRVE